MGKIGVLAVNLGSPAEPTPSAVRSYLRQFLSDPRVIDINPVLRWFLVQGIIAPFRAPKSAAAYRKIWSEDGSPLVVHGHRFVAALGGELGEQYEVVLAMRYGNPSIEDGLARLRSAGCDRVVLFPLYPQYASSSTGSTVERAYRAASREWNTSFLTVVPPFFDDPGFVTAWTELAAPVLDAFQPDHVLFSFHGLPERHVRKSDPTGRHCLAQSTCCDTFVAANRNCYRAQCVATARSLATRLRLGEGIHSLAFQSRLGRDPWLEPYTDVVLPALAQRGIRRVAVFCPAFVADCLETLEEIGIRARAQFLEAGGEALTLVPSLNEHPAWIAAAADLVRRQAATGPGLAHPPRAPSARLADA